MRKSLLLIEDDPIIAIETAHMLETHGFTVTAVHTGEEAIDTVYTNNIHLILMDIDLGSDSIDGAETAEIILKDYDIPIIFLTNYTEPTVVQKTETITSYGYVIKNAGPAVIVATINAAFRLFEKQKKAEGKLQQLIENQNDIIYSIDTKTGEFSYISPVIEDILGYNPQEILEMGGRKTYLTHIVQDNGYLQQEKSLSAYRSGERTGIGHHISMCRCKDGTEKYIEDNWVPVYQNNKLVSFYGILRDVTDRMKTREQLEKTLQEKEYLMEEINHRIKNNLTLITSLIHFKSIECKGTVDLSDLQQQVVAIGMVHEKLYQSNGITNVDFKSYTENLLETIFFSLTNRPVSIQNHIGNILLTAKIAVPLGLIINEIAINAIKHGFSEKEEAVFTIKMEHDTEAEQYILTLSNNGKPFPPEIQIDNSKTLGLQLISDLIEQLEGTIHIQRSPSPVFTITFPANTSS